jgi:hypothetical protein
MVLFDRFDGGQSPSKYNIDNKNHHSGWRSWWFFSCLSSAREAGLALHADEGLLSKLF